MVAIKDRKGNIKIEPTFKKEEGMKWDDGKLRWDKAPWLLFEKIVESITKNPEFRWDLLPFEPIENVVEILTYGARKYEPNNWQKVESRRYFAALTRHMVAELKGEDYDQESGLLHTSHLHCNAMFLDWQKIQEEKRDNILGGDHPNKVLKVMKEAHSNLEGINIDTK